MPPFTDVLIIAFVTWCSDSGYFCIPYFVGITKEPSFISKRRVPYHDPQISKSLEWNGATPENEVVALLQPKAAEAPESQEVEGASQGRVLPLEVPRVPKRTRSHSADSRAEGASDVGDSNEGVKAEHLPLTENVELEHSTKFSSESVDNRVSLFSIYIYFFFQKLKLLYCIHYHFSNLTFHI